MLVLFLLGALSACTPPRTCTAQELCAVDTCVNSQWPSTDAPIAGFIETTNLLEPDDGNVTNGGPDERWV